MFPLLAPSRLIELDLLARVRVRVRAVLREQLALEHLNL